MKKIHVALEVGNYPPDKGLVRMDPRFKVMKEEPVVVMVLFKDASSKSFFSSRSQFL